MKILKWLDEHFEETCMSVLLFLITAIIAYGVFMRYVLNNSPSWAEEITRYCFIWSAFLSISFCIRKGSSIRIDLLLESLPPKWKIANMAFVDIALIAVMIYWLKGALGVTDMLFESGQSSPALLIPMWTVYGASVVGFLLTILRCAQHLFKTISCSAVSDGGK